MFPIKSAVLSAMIAVTAAMMLPLSDATLAQDSDSADAGIAPDNVAPLMRKKLDAAKTILEGLTLERFDRIASNARSLRLLSMEAGWNVVQTEEYRKHSDDFRRTCDQIEQAANAKDIHRAALGYVALTVRCVECHSYMRENKITLTGVQRSDSTDLVE